MHSTKSRKRMSRRNISTDFTRRDVNNANTFLEPIDTTVVVFTVALVSYPYP